MDSRGRAGSATLSKWGLVQGWLVQDRQRRVEIRASVLGLVVAVFDPALGERTTEMTSEEDPSKVAWRLIVTLAQSA